MKAISIYNYLDYRMYLKDLFQDQKKKNKNFSYGYFARISGFGSTGYLKMIMDGIRNLSAKSIHKVTMAFKLNKKETNYFETLVLFNQSKTEQERETYWERLMHLNPIQTKLTGLDREKYEYFTKSYYVVLREMIAIPGFNEDPEWISKQFSPPITPTEARKALQTLLDLQLIKRDDVGRLVQADITIATPTEVREMEVYQYHSQMLGHAKEALLKVHELQRDITALTIPITLKTLPEIKRRIQELRHGIIDLVNQGDHNFDEVYQINIQCFPVTKISAKIKNEG